MDANFSEDFSSKEDQFFKPQRAAAPAAGHVSLTVKIRFLHNDLGKPLQTMPESSAIAPRTKHHELRCSPLAAIANRVRRHFCTWVSRLLSPALLVRHDLKGLAMTSQLAKTDKLLLQRIQTTGFATQQSIVIARCAAARRSGAFITPANGLLQTTGIRNDDGYVTTRQRGAVLITGLIFLVVLTLLGTTALQGTLLEEKMAGNLRDETLAFQAAEAALRSGERFLEQVTLPEFNGSNGLYHHACSSAQNPDAENEDAPYSCPPTPDPVAEMKWNADDSREIDVVAMEGVASQPRYFIEQLPSVPLMGDGGSAQQSPSLLSSMFRIVAQGTGGTESAATLLQSTYRR